ncbi:MAG: hypothetical protein IKZ44_01130 [Clostridia bacterium]|nr:hypothetical protein [Clostridia bacterium]
MPFFLVLPFIVIGIVLATVKKTAEQNKRAEAQRRAEEMQTRQSAAEAKPYTPVRPSVQVPPVREAAPTPRTTPTVQSARTAPRVTTQKQTHPQHDECALRPDQKTASVPPWKHPQHDECSLEPDTAAKPEAYAVQRRVPALHNSAADMDLTPENILRGVIFSEVFGRPKALR